MSMQTPLWVTHIKVIAVGLLFTFALAAWNLWFHDDPTYVVRYLAGDGSGKEVGMYPEAHPVLVLAPLMLSLLISMSIFAGDSLGRIIAEIRREQR